MHVQIDTNVIGNAAIGSLGVWSSRCLYVSVCVYLSTEEEEEHVHGVVHVVCLIGCFLVFHAACSRLKLVLSIILTKAICVLRMSPGYMYLPMCTCISANLYSCIRVYTYRYTQLYLHGPRVTFHGPFDVSWTAVVKSHGTCICHGRAVSSLFSFTAYSWQPRTSIYIRMHTQSYAPAG